MKKNYLLILWRLPAFILLVLATPVVIGSAKFLRLPVHKVMPHWFHWIMRRILALQVVTSGQLHEGRATLYVSNHISYLDIFALGHIRGYYVAKSEVASWPILGSLARLQNTLFVERKVNQSKKSMHLMQQHMQQGNNLILFPEGTSSDGTEVLAFKSSLFAAADITEHRTTIQPISIAYTKYNGRKMTKKERDHYAWYGTTPFAPHFFQLFFAKKSTIAIHYHDSVFLADYPNRKAVAEHCHRVVAEKLKQLNQ